MSPPLGTIVLAVALAAGACTGGGTPQPTASLSPVQPSPSASLFPAGVHYGSAVFGAEQWPECLNPITECALSRWAFLTVFQHVLPRAMEVSIDGLFVASPLLREAPTLENGGLTQTPFTVTFHIRDGAVWDDGSPITADDFAFTWRAARFSKGSIWVDRYRYIESVDTSDPGAAVLRLRGPYAPWPELFGGSFGFVLKASAFPGLAAAPEPDLSNQMADRIPFSGGPFRLASWSRDGAELVRNDRYFGSRAHLDRVTFEPAEDAPHELQRFFAGEIEAVAAELDVARLLLDLQGSPPGIKAIGGSGTEVEALWFNLEGPPLDDPGVRYALAHAIDRQGLIDEIVRSVDPNATPLNCGLLAIPGVGPWCATQPFARFDYDPTEARTYLRGAGYDCSKLICTKDDIPLTINYAVQPTSQLDRDVRAFLLKSAQKAGIELGGPNSEFVPIGGLSVYACPSSGSPVTSCALAAPTDPSVTDLFAFCEPVVPGDEAHFAWCNRTAALYAQQADAELDPDHRRELMEKVYGQEAGDVIGLPLFVVPALSLWREDKIAGPIAAYSSTVYGMFFNMNEWYVVS